MNAANPSSNPISSETTTPFAFAETVLDGSSKQHELGQFLTPAPVAEFMAGLFETHRDEVHLLDAGAGAGALTAALVQRLCRQQRPPRSISVTTYEVDAAQIEPLQTTLEHCHRRCEDAGVLFVGTVHHADFIASTVPLARNDLFSTERPLFNTAILNPPYRKIRSESTVRLLLRSAGIEVSNLYAGFVALAARLLIEGGEMVAITPRSFCNGPYFKPFRSNLLETMSLRRLHLFDSRSAAFGGDGVLQENIIFHAAKGTPKPDRVIISNSSGETGGAVAERAVEYDEVVSPDDPEGFIHLPIDDRHVDARQRMERLSTSLSALGMSVSTGRVVDFRARRSLCDQPGSDTAPLIYPCHCQGGFVRWPRENSRKPNAILSNEQTRDLLVPSGNYVLVKRFTSKEERRRVVASIYDPRRIKAPLVGIENHLNYFHDAGHGLPMVVARGLAAYLNSTVVDIYFRQFNGHTQVNATDLRSLNYPSWADLERLGGWISDPGIAQEDLDAIVEREIFR